MALQLLCFISSSGTPSFSASVTIAFTTSFKRSLITESTTGTKMTASKERQQPTPKGAPFYNAITVVSHRLRQESQGPCSSSPSIAALRTRL
jgi:hypothetical protein